MAAMVAARSDDGDFKLSKFNNETRMTDWLISFGNYFQFLFRQ